MQRTRGFDSREKRIENYTALRAELGKTFATRPRAEWTQRLEAEDVPYAPVHNVDEVIDDEQVRHLGTFYQQQHPKEGEIWGINPPVFIDGERPGPMRPPPVLGEHSEQNSRRTWARPRRNRQAQGRQGRVASRNRMPRHLAATGGRQ